MNNSLKTQKTKIEKQKRKHRNIELDSIKNIFYNESCLKKTKKRLYKSRKGSQSLRAENSPNISRIQDFNILKYPYQRGDSINQEGSLTQKTSQNRTLKSYYKFVGTGKKFKKSRSITNSEHFRIKNPPHQIEVDSPSRNLIKK